VANNLIIDRSRRKRPLRLEELGEDGWEPSEDPRPMINLGIDAAAIRRVIIRLKPEHRDVITFRFIEDLGPREIAAITGETENTVSVRLHRAIASLRKLIAEQGTKIADPV
jgi:RNA polymerase sigma-70 factor (ECF subfamily)